ncbi:MAG TPA: zf-TFIIB domain-containing protein [Chloroflexia bacterium]|nr:zf-TFIIB domain-containing protein [Chloroflexia bacterium]
MKCPVCNVDLKMSERQGVEIDYCAQCRGVWLDRGELDKIIERSMSLAMPLPPGAGQPEEYEYQTTRNGGYYNTWQSDNKAFDYNAGAGKTSGQRRKGFLGDIFDFD